MKMAKYILKRITLMFFVLFVITAICFVLIRILPRELPTDKVQAQAIAARWEALGYNEPLFTQFVIYLRNIFTEWDWGTSWYIQFREPAWDLLTGRLLPTVMVNFYSLILSIPIGIALGIYAAIKKNKWQDSFISTMVMVFISVPSYVYAFMLQYFLYFKLGWLPFLMKAGTNWFTWEMFVSMLPAVMSLSFGVIAGFTRTTRAELTEVLTSEFMLLARTKGLTKAQATVRHAMRNCFVVVVPAIFGQFIGILGGSC